jgi:dienelactone hydrolase
VLGPAAAALGVGVVVLVARDGQPVWQATRALAAVVVAMASTWLVGSGRPRLLRGVTSFVVGFVGVATGAGVGGWHALAGGPWLPTVGGLVVLAAALVLWAGGAALLVRATPRWWRIGTVPLVAAVSLLGLPATTIGVAATNVPRQDLGDRTPADVGLVAEDVTFPTVDNVLLSGWYVPSRHGGAVVLLHGAGSTRTDVLDQAAVLARHGYGVLLFDARGQGRSGGRAMALGWYGDEDSAAAVSFLAGRSDVDPERIGAVGLSMGGEEAIGAAAADGRIRAVVAEGATNRVAADVAWLSSAFGWRGWVQERVQWITYSVADLLTAADPPTSLRAAVAAAAPRPVLLITASEVDDETRAGRYIQEGAPESVEVWEVPGADHTGGLDARPADWERRVTAFLDAALGVAPA